jgi:hypothetical protein
MIANIVKGTGFRGTAEYLFHGHKDEEEKERGEIVFSNMAGKTPRELASEWGVFRRLRPKLGKAVCHVSLSLSPEDGTLNDAAWSDIAQRFMNELGFAECPYVAIRHDDTEHAHIHLLASRVDRNGDVVSDKHDFARAEKILRRIEADYKLRRVQSSHDKNNNKEGEAMNDKAQQYIENRLSAAATEAEATQALPTTSPECGVAECGDENLTDKKRRNYQRRLLEDSYSRQVAMMLAGIVRYVERKPNLLIVHTNDGGMIRDTGDKLTAINMPLNESAERLVLISISKGWESVLLSGNDEFLKVAMRMALQRGLKVRAVGPNQLSILAQVETEIRVSVVTPVFPSQPTPKVQTTTPTNPVDGMTGLAGVNARAQERRGWANAPHARKYPNKWPK